ncbi:MAG: ferritin-like domain-containing protein [Nitrospiraceae bacterium]|nr:ferritin-like domain-containing protein [Nitrospiraceae bacterium]MDA8325208.1 ferritin-like domain-containing protein [Nitrospiraceae bacterium]
MASKELLDMLNEAISNELQVSIQYMWQHVVCRGVNSESVGGVFKQIAMAEMKHAEAIADRLDYLGGSPTTKPTPITVGDTIKSMLSLDKKAEEDAIALYKRIIAKADGEKDVSTRTLFEGILSAEEDHHNKFTTLMEAD